MKQFVPQPCDGDLNTAAILSYFFWCPGQNGSHQSALFCYLNKACTMWQKLLNAAENFCTALWILLRQQNKAICYQAARQWPEHRHHCVDGAKWRPFPESHHAKRQCIPALWKISGSGKSKWGGGCLACGVGIRPKAWRDMVGWEKDWGDSRNGK